MRFDCINASLSYSVRRDVTITSDLCETLFIEIQSDRTTKGLLPHKTKKNAYRCHISVIGARQWARRKLGDRTTENVSSFRLSG